MKVKSSIKRICARCKVIKRRGKIYIVCSERRHNQRQG